MLIPLSIENKPPPGTWSPRRIDGKNSASFVCSKCGDAATLADHTISSTGVVQPSVMCAAPNCDYHDHITLVGWVAE